MFCPNMLCIESLASLPIISSYRISPFIFNYLSKPPFFSLNIINVTNYSIYFICSFFNLIVSYFFKKIFARCFLSFFFLFYISLFFFFLTTTLYCFLILVIVVAICQCWKANYKYPIIRVVALH